MPKIVRRIQALNHFLIAIPLLILLFVVWLGNKTSSRLSAIDKTKLLNTLRSSPSNVYKIHSLDRARNF